MQQQGDTSHNQKQRKDHQQMGMRLALGKTMQKIIFLQDMVSKIPINIFFYYKTNPLYIS